MNIKKEQLNELFQNKKILVTGGTGSIGSEIVIKLLKYNPSVIRIFSNDENATFHMQSKLGEHKNLRYLLGDVRDKERLKIAMEGIDYVYHAAALKHVPLCEYNPFEALKTNILGTQNVIDAALESSVKKVINISTDKAVNPTNTMGATKLLAEKLIRDANFYRGHKETIFASVRFGNVLYSRGSVIPTMEEMIKNGKPVTITNPSMTRFFMSIPETIELIFKATLLAKGGEIFILKMPIIQIGDLFDVIIEETSKELGIDIGKIEKKIIGQRPGEKIYEELLTDSEALHALESEDMFIVLPDVDIPGLKDETLEKYNSSKITKRKSYSSADSSPLAKEEIRKLLREAKNNNYIFY